MNKAIFVIMLIFPLITNISCNNKIEKVTENINLAEETINYRFKIKITGEYGNWGRVYYDYEMNSYCSENLVINIFSGGEFRESYNMVLSDNKLKEIFEFIEKYDLNKEIEREHMWVGSHGFIGHFIIEIDNNVYYKIISSGQNKEAYIYEIINYLNSFLPDEFYIPIEYL